MFDTSPSPTTKVIIKLVFVKIMSESVILCPTIDIKQLVTLLLPLRQKYRLQYFPNNVKQFYDCLNKSPSCQSESFNYKAKYPQQIQSDCKSKLFSFLLNTFKLISL